MRFRRVVCIRTGSLVLSLIGFLMVSPVLARQRATVAEAPPGAEPLSFVATGHTFHGDWTAQVEISRTLLESAADLQIDVTLTLASTHLASLAAAGIKADRLCVLLTLERTFDANGWMRLSGDEKMSTLLTPTGLAIEGGAQGAVTTRYGYYFKSPFDELVSIPLSEIQAGPTPDTRLARFSVSRALPVDLPPGLYRLRADFGVMVGKSTYNFNGYTFAARIFSTETGTSTYVYSPTVLPASGRRVDGRAIDAAWIQPRFPWTLLANYNSNGYYGVVADEDRHRFALSNRNLIPDDVILPLYDSSGNRLSYSLEPQFPADTIDAALNIPWNFASGEMTVQIAGPDGSVATYGPSKFLAKNGYGPTTKNTSITAWKPQAYGRYTVTASGWIADATGRRYESGGTYRFWIAKRMTLATATFQGMPYPVGSTYGRDIQFNPAVPADVQVAATLYPNSDAGAAQSLTYSGKASPAGLFGAAQGMKSFPLSAPGEYHAQVTATYTDAEGHLWVSTMRHAGIVYPEPSAVVARGKKFLVNNKYVDRGETKFEGYIASDGAQYLSHITFPYNAGDVLLIGAEGQGANKIEPVLIYEMSGTTPTWDTGLNGVGTTNLRIKTSNGYSPHLYPEYITDLEYFYGAAPRPGFMGRFIVGESLMRAPYWAVSPNSFGSQIGATANGDAPGDIYRLIGGVVLRRSGQAPLYSGYIASAFLLPKGSNNNRVVAPGSEDLYGPLGERARFYLVGLRPGTAYETGSTFRPALQIDPLLPVAITFTLTWPDGRQQTATGTGDRFGSFAGPTAWTLDVAGVYRYQIHATWNGYEGRMPGLPESGGEFFVYSRTRPAGATGLRIDGASQRTFSAAGTVTVSGTSTASTVHYTLITPGAVIEQGDLKVSAGKFQYLFDPVAVHAKVPIYDVTSITTGLPQIGRVIHLTFFAEEKSTAGASFFDVTRVILRGTTVLAARPVVTTTLALSDILQGIAGSSGLAAGRTGAPASGDLRVTAVEAAALREWDARADDLVRRNDLEVVRRDTDTVLAGTVHERLRQLYQGVPVVGADITRQLRNGASVSMFGALRTGIDVGVRPELGADSAQATAERHTGGRTTPGRAPLLVVLPLEDGGYALAWEVETRMAVDVRLSYVDAIKGSMLLDYSTLRTLEAQAPASTPALVIDLKGDAARAASIRRSGTFPHLSEAASAADPDRVTAAARRHANLSEDYFRQRFARLGIDGEGSAPVVAVHPASTGQWRALGSRYRSYFLGGAWDGRMAMFGDGLAASEAPDGREWRPAAAALDIVAHEISHAVMDAGGGLIYRHESGALAEAFADIMAVAVERSASPRQAGGGPLDYLIGEDVVDGGLRSLASPGMHGFADHYARRATGGPDNGGVHANALIAGHAFYLAVEGGRNATSGLTVEGVGATRGADMERVFYRAFVYLLPSNATFSMARAATIQSARDLFGADSAAEHAVAQAWSAVGVE